MALVCSDYLIESGGLDLIFGVINNADSFPDEKNRAWFEMRGWQALSDQSNSPKAAEAIANYGGPNKGMELAVTRLKAHHAPFELKSNTLEHYFINKLTLRYEIS